MVVKKGGKKRIVRVVVMARIVCLCCGNTIFRDAVTSITIRTFMVYVYYIRPAYIIHRRGRTRVRKKFQTNIRSIEKRFNNWTN